MRNNKSLSIAFVGIRGVPASYSGFETFVEELGWRLVRDGFKVRVYNRTTHIKSKEKNYRGMEIVRLPTIPTKATDTIVHSFFSVLHLLFKPADIVYVCGVGSSLVAWIPRLRGMKVIINVDGADWKRKKWGPLGRWFLKISERISLKAGNIIIADALAVKDYYEKNYNAQTVYIPYGTNFSRDERTELLRQFGLERDRYFLFVGRLVPENNAHLIIESYKKVKDKLKDIKLVIVGDAPYAEDYKNKLREISRGIEGIVFTGYQFGNNYRQLSSHCFAFILASEVGGTHPVLVEQMGFGNCIIAIRTQSNVEVLGDAGLIFEPENAISKLGEKMLFVAENEKLRKELKQRAFKRANQKYSWEAVVESYEKLFKN